MSIGEAAITPFGECAAAPASLNSERTASLPGDLGDFRGHGGGLKVGKSPFTAPSAVVPEALSAALPHKTWRSRATRSGASTTSQPEDVDDVDDDEPALDHADGAVDDDDEGDVSNVILCTRGPPPPADAAAAEAAGGVAGQLARALPCRGVL